VGRAPGGFGAGSARGAVGVGGADLSGADGAGASAFAVSAVGAEFCAVADQAWGAGGDGGGSAGESVVAGGERAAGFVMGVRWWGSRVG
jgi:hypothetical protein